MRSRARILAAGGDTSATIDLLRAALELHEAAGEPVAAHAPSWCSGRSNGAIDGSVRLGDRSPRQRSSFPRSAQDCGR